VGSQQKSGPALKTMRHFEVWVRSGMSESQCRGLIHDYHVDSFTWTEPVMVVLDPKKLQTLNPWWACKLELKSSESRLLFACSMTYNKTLDHFLLLFDWRAKEESGF
jgi:hypothetical protein